MRASTSWKFETTRLSSGGVTLVTDAPKARKRSHAPSHLAGPTSQRASACSRARRISAGTYAKSSYASSLVASLPPCSPLHAASSSGGGLDDDEDEESEEDGGGEADDSDPEIVLDGPDAFA